jgi:hypothetical protein
LLKHLKFNFRILKGSRLLQNAKEGSAAVYTDLEPWQMKATVVYPASLFGGGSTNSVEDRENGDLGAVAPESGVVEAAVIWYKKFHFI